MYHNKTKSAPFNFLEKWLDYVKFKLTAPFTKNYQNIMDIYMNIFLNTGSTINQICSITSIIICVFKDTVSV